MPTFKAAPSTNLRTSIMNAVRSARSDLDPTLAMQVDQAAADTGHKLALVEKLRQEMEISRGKADAEAEAERRRRDPALQMQFASDVAGLDTDTGTRLSKALRNVRERPMVEMDDEGNAMPDVSYAVPETVTPAQRGRFQQALAAQGANMLGAKHSGADDIAKATGLFQEQGITQAVQDAIASGNVFGASAMNQGAKPGTAIKLYDNVGDTGATFAPATGAVQADPAAQPGNNLLSGTIARLSAQERQAAAAAQASGASAEASRAHAGLYLAQTDSERNKPADGPKPPPGYVWGAPDATGNPTLVPIAGGPADKLGETQVKQQVGVQNTRAAIGEYLGALKNWKLTDMASPNARAKMGTIYNNLLLQAKEAYNLGVLNGPDYQILQTVITDPTSLKAGIISNEALADQAKKLDGILQRIGTTVANVSKQRGAGPAVGHVEDGYRFKGGDPSKPENWMKI